MLTFLKLGGSLLTDKRVERSFRQETAQRLASEIASALRAAPDLRLVIGHGSGSFGHFAAKRFGTIQGVRTPEEWQAFAQVAAAAADLNGLVSDILRASDIPIWRIQPSASARCKDGRLVAFATHTIQTAVEHKLVPLVYGDVALDSVRGGTIISTETILSYLALHLPVDQMILVGEVDGVFDQSNEVIPHITLSNFGAIESALGGSAGVDVTGGMDTKVRDMLELVSAVPGLTIRIMNGLQPGLLEATLLGTAQPGTVITAASPL